jgi:hypothetical protein
MFKSISDMKNSSKYMREWIEKNPDKYKKDFIDYGLRYYQRLKEKVMRHYSNGTMACAKCGFTDMRALSIDHLNGKGADERRRLFGNRGYAGRNMYLWLQRNDFPEGYQVLCANCQWIKRAENKEYGQRIKGSISKTL